MGRPPNPRSPNLTRREFEIYMLIVGRAMNTEKIVKELGISWHTARTHQRRILTKMNMGNALELLVQYHRKEIPDRVEKIEQNPAA